MVLRGKCIRAMYQWNVGFYSHLDVALSLKSSPLHLLAFHVISLSIKPLLLLPLMLQCCHSPLVRCSLGKSPARPINQSINQSTNQPTDQPTNQPTNQPINQPTNTSPMTSRNKDSRSNGVTRRATGTLACRHFASPHNLHLDRGRASSVRRSQFAWDLACRPLPPPLPLPLLLSLLRMTNPAHENSVN